MKTLWAYTPIEGQDHDPPLDLHELLPPVARSESKLRVANYESRSGSGPRITNSELLAAFRLPIAALLLSLLAIGGCGRKPAAGTAMAPGSGTALAAPAATPVTIAPVISHDISKTIQVTGSLVALQDVVVGTKLAGRLASVYFHEGDAVSAGQAVAQMDTVDLAAQAQQAQANLQTAITKVEQARAQMAEAQSALQQAKTTLRYTRSTTASAVAAAQAGVQAAQEQLAVVQQGARPQERQQAEEQVRSAKASYDKARSDLKRYQQLFRQDVVPQIQLDQAQATRDSAEAAYNSALQAQSLMQAGARPEQVREAELAVMQAKDALAKAEADRDSIVLRGQDVASARAGVNVAAAGIHAAEAGVAQSQAALRIARNGLANTRIQSPITGIVAERRAEPGQQLGAGAAVMRIVSPRSVYFQAVLSESQYAYVRPGQSATVTVDALPGRAFAGHVTRILPVASSAARNFSVRIDFPPHPRLRPQMFARGAILVGTHHGATLVPKDAVIFDPSRGTARVFITRPDGTVAERSVRLGYSTPRYVEILSGVQPSQQVVTTGQTALQDGDRVKVQSS